MGERETRVRRERSRRGATAAAAPAQPSEAAAAHQDVARLEALEEECLVVLGPPAHWQLHHFHLAPAASAAAPAAPGRKQGYPCCHEPPTCIRRCGDSAREAPPPGIAKPEACRLELYERRTAHANISLQSGEGGA